MGWIVYADRVREPKAELDKLCNWESKNDTGGVVTHRALKSALVNFTEYYAAVETFNTDSGERVVWAAVMMVTLNPFGYKDMSEDMGPGIHRCPESILKLLTPTENEYAKQWRADAWNHIAARAAAPKVGEVIEFAEPVSFTDGAEYRTFEIVKYRKAGKAFRPVGGYGLYKITGWQRMAYKVVTS